MYVEKRKNRWVIMEAGEIVNRLKNLPYFSIENEILMGKVYQEGIPHVIMRANCYCFAPSGAEEEILLLNVHKNGKYTGEQQTVHMLSEKCITKAWMYWGKFIRRRKLSYKKRKSKTKKQGKYV